MSLTQSDDGGNFKEYDIPDDFDMDELMLRKENIVEVAKSMDKLNEDDRQMLLLRYSYNYSTKMIAEAMSMNPNTVDSRLFRAKKKLYIMLKEYYNG